MAVKKDSSPTLENILWNCRVALRGVGSTEKNRDAVISLVFLKFAGDKFENRRAEIVDEHGNITHFLEKIAFYTAANVFYLRESARWSYIVKNAASNEIAVIIDKALADIESDNPALKGALPLNLFSTLGIEKSRIKSLVDNVNKLNEKIFHEEDLIGRVYEYFLQAYAASGTKDIVDDVLKRYKECYLVTENKYMAKDYLKEYGAIIYREFHKRENYPVKCIFTYSGWETVNGKNVYLSDNTSRADYECKCGISIPVVPTDKMAQVWLNDLHILDVGKKIYDCLHQLLRIIIISDN